VSAPSELERIAQRRAELLARADAQRAALGYYYQQFERPVRQAETAVGLANSLRRSPLFLTGLAAVLLRTPWRKLARVPKFAWRGWRVLQFVRSLKRVEAVKHRTS